MLFIELCVKFIVKSDCSQVTFGGLSGACSGREKDRRDTRNQVWHKDSFGRVYPRAQ